VGGGYLWCDGDNRADDPGGAPRPPILYTWQQITAAQPIALIVFELPQQEHPMGFQKQSDGTGKDTLDHTCGVGFMSELLARIETADGRMSETYIGDVQGFKSFLPLANGDVLVWDGAHVTHDSALVDAELYRLLAPFLANPPTPDPLAVAAKTTLTQFKKVLADLP
jgi:hypothetical protein